VTDIQTTSLLLQLFYQCFYYYHYHHRYHYPYHQHFMLCAIGLYMYCRRCNTNDCLRLRLRFHIKLYIETELTDCDSGNISMCVCACVIRQHLDYEQQKSSAERSFREEQRRTKQKCLVCASHLSIVIHSFACSTLNSVGLHICSLFL